ASGTALPGVEFGIRQVLVRPYESTPVGPGAASVNRDVERFVIAVPPPRLRQLAVLDRRGKGVGTIGQPGLFGQTRLSPDGKRLAVVKNDPQTGNTDIWVFDVATGKGTPITNDNQPDNSPVWSPDGKQVAYVSFKDSY